MAISAAKQAPDTYLLWQRFSYPAESGPKDAIAVPTEVANQLNAAYSIMFTMLMANVWAIIIGIVVFLNWRIHKHKPHPLFSTLWNKRADLLSSIIETFKYSKETSRPPWVFPLLLLILLAWVGQTALGIVAPPLLILGSAAPVNPNTIYIPAGYTDGEANSTTATRVTLEIPWALRALGSVDLANKDLRGKVDISSTISQGTWTNGESILRVDYGYRVSGTDFGLQRYPGLLLNVTGSCVTEYGWFNGSDITSFGKSLIAVDYYNLFFDPSQQHEVSLFDSRGPLSMFYLGKRVKGTLENSNTTWAALVSSVNRTSFSSGGDPWYLTDSGGSGAESTGAGYTVKPARPALSCWQDDVWSYKGRTSTVVELTSTALPGLELSADMQTVLSRYLDAPMIQQIGSRLGPSSLKSATTAIGQIFDAKASSFQADLERLVLASYIATNNILTDSTLYPAGADGLLENLVKGANGQIEPGVDEFVVWSSDVSALSLVIVIAVPSVLVGVWLLSVLLLYLTSVGIVNALDSRNMFHVLQDAYPNATLVSNKKGPTWNLNGQRDQRTGQDPKLDMNKDETIVSQSSRDAEIKFQRNSSSGKAESRPGSSWKKV